jgi:hypothetical protein
LLLRGVTIAVTVAAIALAASVFVAPPHGPSDVPIQILHASWAFNYSSTADLAEHSDVVLVGTISKVATEGEDQLSPGVAATQYVVSVDRYVKGTGAKSIVVKQSGGRLGSVRQVVEGDPPMVVGNRYLLYLSRVPDGPYAGNYIVLGGPQGRFGVDSSDKLTPIGSVTAPEGVNAGTITAQQ